MKSLVLQLLTLLCAIHVSAQNKGNIKIKLIDNGNNEAYFNLLLKKSDDSSLVKIESAKAGQAVIFENILFGNYFLYVTYLNRKVTEYCPISLNTKDTSLPELEIKDLQIGMKDVKVIAQKNILERRFDKLIYNVENTLTSPVDDAISILQKSPNISLDQNGNISMRGKSGVLIMINGKQTYLQGEQLNQLLKSTMASQISKIEIITNPSSKYDANGNAGIVNIILKKDHRHGTNGTLTLSYGHGVYRKSNNNLSLNYRNEKLNLYGSYNFVHNKSFNDLELYRLFYNNGQVDGAYRQHNYLTTPIFLHIPKVGVDYHLTKKTILGFVVTGLSNYRNSSTENKTYIENGNFVTQSSYNTSNRSKDLWTNYGANANLIHSFDSLGRELSVDGDYARYTNKVTQNFMTRYFDLQNIEFKQPYILLGKVNSHLNINAVKIDYVHPLKNNSKLECGAKTSLVKANNNLSFYNQSNGIDVFDSSQSNHFIYQENINALYTNFSFEVKKYLIQAGLRSEQTIANGEQLLNQNNFKRNYWQLFPTLFISHKINDNHELGFSFSRRILRPSYEQLNPFKFFIDANTYSEGNPYLVPQNTYLFELNYTFKQRYLLSFSSSITNKSITEVLIPAEGQRNITIQTNKNMNKQYIHSISLSAPIQIKTWWNAMFDGVLYYSLYDGELASQNIHSNVISANAKTIQTIMLLKQVTLQIDGFIQFSEHYSFATLGTFSAVNMSLQKSVWHKKLSFKLSANDIFYSSRFRGSSNFNNYHEDFYVQRDTRTMMLTITYRFGNTSLQAARKRAGSAEEEKQRAGK